jgi:alkylated DNA repair dioxygenase AlkB
MKINNDQNFMITDEHNKVLVAYFPRLCFNNLRLNQVPFTRVKYISRFNKVNITPRLTWAYSQIGDAPIKTSFRNLDFMSEPMPDWLQEISNYLEKICQHNWNFNPNYNTVLLSKYEGGEDNISFHIDDETFLAHHFNANVVFGAERDFQFRLSSKNKAEFSFYENGKFHINNGNIETHEIRLADSSVLFTKAVEHALPKRKNQNGIRYSLSFRCVKDKIGIGNIFYYCRGVESAIDNERKSAYLNKLEEL